MVEAEASSHPDPVAAPQPQRRQNTLASMHRRCLDPAPGPLNAALSGPPSKSWTPRALVAAALAAGPSRIVRPLDASDTRCTRRGIVSLGVTVEDAADAWIVHGRGGVIDGG